MSGDRAAANGISSPCQHDEGSRHYAGRLPAPRHAYQRTEAPSPITRPSRIVLGTRYVPDEFA